MMSSLMSQAWQPQRFVSRFMYAEEVLSSWSGHRILVWPLSLG